MVGIPTLNEEKMIAACLQSLFEGSPGAENATFVVADGGSTDRTREIVETLRAKSPNLYLIDNPGKLQSFALNLVAEFSEGRGTEILIRCDAHSLYPKGFLSGILQSFNQTNADSIVVPMDSYGSTPFGRGAAWVVDTPFGSGGATHRGGRRSGFVDHGHHAGFKMKRFLELGGYDTSFRTNEDAEYDRRLTEAGGRIWMNADCRIDYNMRSTAVSLGKQYWLYGEGRALTILKHRMLPKLRQLLPVIALFGLVGSSLTGFLLNYALFLVPALYISCLIAISIWLAIKHRSLDGLWAGPALAIIQNAWACGFCTRMVRHAIGKRTPTSIS